MSKRPRCFICGRGLSQKHRISIEVRLLLAIFNKPSTVCVDDAERLSPPITQYTEAASA